MTVSVQPRHRSQAGTTLIELLVSVAIMSLALVLLVGAFSTGLVDSTVIKRTTTADAAVKFELERIQAAAFDSTPSSYSECFSDDTAAAPSSVGYQAGCPAGTSIRLDVTETDVQTGALQDWTVRVVTYPGLAGIGTAVSVYKMNR